MNKYHGSVRNEFYERAREVHPDNLASFLTYYLEERLRRRS